MSFVIFNNPGYVLGTATNAVYENVLSRHFALFDSVQQGYMQLEQPVVFTGDFEVEFWVMTNSSSDTQVMMGGGITPERFYIGIEGGLLLIGNGSERIVTTKSLNDGMFHLLKWKLSGNVVSVHVDDELEYSETKLFSSPKEIKFISGDSSSSFYFNGIISDVKFTDNSDPQNPITQTYALGNDVGNDVEYPKENVFGSELITNGDFSNGDAGWSLGEGWSVSDGTVKRVGGGSSSQIEQLGIFEQGSLYEIKYDLVVNAGEVAMYIGQGSQSLGVTRSTGSHTKIVKSTSTQDKFVVTSNGVAFDGSIDNISIRKITNALTYYNRTETPIYTRTTDGWLGQELVVNGGFDTDSDWVKNSGAYISDGVATLVAQGNTSISQDNISGVYVGGTYKLSWDVVLAGNHASWDLLFPKFSAETEVLGHYSAINTALDVRLRLIDGFADEECSVDNVSLKHLIQLG